MIRKILSLISTILTALGDKEQTGEAKFETVIKAAVADILMTASQSNSKHIRLAGQSLEDIKTPAQVKEALTDLKTSLTNSLDELGENSPESKATIENLLTHVTDKIKSIEAKLADLDEHSPLSEEKRSDIITDLTDLVRKILEVTSLTVRDT